MTPAEINVTGARFIADLKTEICRFRALSTHWLLASRLGPWDSTTNLRNRLPWMKVRLGCHKGIINGYELVRSSPAPEPARNFRLTEAINLCTMNPC